MIFGTYRLILALAVVLNHLGGFRDIGRYAVFGFFILSGFLMTLILHESYGYSALGLKKYALNRFLRIYPAYWALSLVTLVFICLFSAQFVKFHDRIFLPPTLSDWVKNICILVFKGTRPQVVPQAWALTVELFWYILIAAGVSKTRKRTWIWWTLGLLYAVAVNILGLDWDWKYFNFASAALPFATGALFYHYKTEVQDGVRKLGAERLLLIFFVAFWINALFFRYGSDFMANVTRRNFCFYANYLIQALAFAALVACHFGKNSRFAKLDKWMGSLSYPIYLNHNLVGFLLFLVFGKVFSNGTMKLFWLSLIPLLLFSWAMAWLIDRPIENLRIKIKKDGKKEGDETGLSSRD